MTVTAYADTLECMACGGTATPRLTPRPAGTPVREYQCMGCGRHGAIRTRDGHRLGPVFTGRTTQRHTPQPTPDTRPAVADGGQPQPCPVCGIRWPNTDLTITEDGDLVCPEDGTILSLVGIEHATDAAGFQTAHARGDTDD
jgi:hypothetical protein